MATEAAEKDLVSRFNLQEVKPDVKLNLGKYGKILVQDIYGMTRIASTVDTKVTNVDDIFNSPFKNVNPLKW